MEVQRRRRRGMPERRWLHSARHIREKGLSGEYVNGRATRRFLASYIAPT